MSQNNPGDNNKPRRRTLTTSTTSTSKGTNPLNIIPPSFKRGLGQQRTTGQGMSVSSSKNLPRNSSSGKGLPRPPTSSSLPSPISSISSLSSSSSLNIPIDITTQIETDSKNVLNAIQNNRKIKKSVIDFDKKKFSVMSNFLEFEKEDGTYQIKFPTGYAEVGNKIYLGKDNGGYYIGIKKMPYNEIVNRKYEKLLRLKPNVNELNETIREIFPKQSYYSNNNNNNNNNKNK